MPPTRPELPQVWTIRDIIQWGKEFFTARGIDDARRNIEMMVCAVLDVRRIELYTDHERPLSKQQLADLKAMVQRRISREPLQYILGKADFYGSTYIVNPAVLIPRPETEILVERVARLCNAHPEHQYRCVDIGTGSGCIPLAVILHTSNTTWTALDFSQEALNTAEQNALLLNAGSRCNMQLCDILSSIPAGAPFDIVTMNPPYIAASEMGQLEPELKDHEPLSALTDQGDGLAFYRRIIEIFDAIVAPGGYLFLEIGHGQQADVENIAASKGYVTTAILDLAGIPRVVVVER